MTDIITQLSGEGSVQQKQINLNNILTLLSRMLLRKPLDEAEIASIERITVQANKNGPQQLLDDYRQYYVSLIRSCQTKEDLEALRIKIAAESEPLTDTYLTKIISRELHFRARIFASLPAPDQAIYMLSIQFQGLKLENVDILSSVPILFNQLQEARTNMLKSYDDILTPLHILLDFEESYHKTIIQLYMSINKIIALDICARMPICNELLRSFFAYKQQFYSAGNQAYLFLAAPSLQNEINLITVIDAMYIRSDIEISFRQLADIMSNLQIDDLQVTLMLQQWLERLNNAQTQANINQLMVQALRFALDLLKSNTSDNFIYDLGKAIALYKQYIALYDCLEKNKINSGNLKLNVLWNHLINRVINLIGIDKDVIAENINIKESIDLIRSNINEPGWLLEFVAETVVGNMRELFAEEEIPQAKGPDIDKLKAAKQNPLKLSIESSVAEQQEALSQVLLLSWEARKGSLRRSDARWRALNTTELYILKEQIEIFKILAEFIQGFEPDNKYRLMRMIRAIENEYIPQLKPIELHEYKSSLIYLASKNPFKGLLWDHIMETIDVIDLFYSETYGKEGQYPPTLGEYVSSKTAAAEALENPDRLVPTTLRSYKNMA